MATKDNFNKAEPAELPDDTEFDAGANYEFMDPCKPINPQPGFRYFAAANDGDNSRPDGVARCKQMGYEVCTEESCMSTDCVLMRIPMAKWEARQRAKRPGQLAQIKQGNLVAGVPEQSQYATDTHGKMRSVTGKAPSRE